jgi:ATP phosphoribosyltransferase
MNTPLKIALAKGRLFETMIEILKRLGYDFPGIASTKALSVSSACGRVAALAVRSADVPTYVAYGAADLGVVGKDVLMEFGDDEGQLFELLDLGFGRCRLVVATTGGATPTPAVWRVATKYPLFTERAFQSMGRPVEVVKLYGSVELAPQAGIADAIVDMVETGSTLKANGLQVINELGTSTARLISNRVLYKIRGEKLRELVRAIEGAIA